MELTDAFQNIGTSNKDTIQNTLNFRKKDIAVYEQNKLHTDACLKYTIARISELEAAAHKKPDSIEAKVAAGLKKYLECLQTWADGADIDLKDAWNLQFERFGCQTVLVRGTDGAVLLAHTEEWGVEDDEAAVLGNHASWSTFITPDGKKLQAFTGYPAAMPGSSFGMTEKTIFAVDSIEHQEIESDIAGVPAAVTTWLCWYLGDSADAKKIIETIGFHDGGYALNQIFKNEKNKPNGRTIEFVGNRVVERRLGRKPLRYQIHTNRIENKRLRATHGAESEYDEYYESVTDTHRKVRESWLGQDQKKRPNKRKQSLRSLQREIGLVPFSVDETQQHEQTANEDTIATFVASMDVTGYKEGIVSAGPQISGGKTESNFLRVR